MGFYTRVPLKASIRDSNKGNDNGFCKGFYRGLGFRCTVSEVQGFGFRV